MNFLKLLPKMRRLKRIKDSQSGSAAIEFGLLAIPFFMIIFAIVETFVAYAGEQLLSNATDTLARQLRTGEITFNLNRPTTDVTKSSFTKKLCDEISLMLSCDVKNIGTDKQKLFIDLKKVTNYRSIDTGIPKVNNERHADLKTSSFQFSPGGPGEINVLRVYYKWGVVVDLVRPYITNVRPGGGTPEYYLMVATTAFKNESYP